MTTPFVATPTPFDGQINVPQDISDMVVVSTVVDPLTELANGLAHDTRRPVVLYTTSTLDIDLSLYTWARLVIMDLCGGGGGGGGAASGGGGGGGGGAGGGGGGSGIRGRLILTFAELYAMYSTPKTLRVTCGDGGAGGIGGSGAGAAGTNGGPGVNSKIQVVSAYTDTLIEVEGGRRGMAGQSVSVGGAGGNGARGGGGGGVANIGGTADLTPYPYWAGPGASGLGTGGGAGGFNTVCEHVPAIRGNTLLSVGGGIGSGSYLGGGGGGGAPGHYAGNDFVAGCDPGGAGAGTAGAIGGAQGAGFGAGGGGGGGGGGVAGPVSGGDGGNGGAGAFGKALVIFL